MANATNDYLPESTPSASFQRIVLIGASMLILLACCVILSILTLWLFDSSNLSQTWPVSLLWSPTPTITPTATLLPTLTPSSTSTSLPTPTPSATFTPSATPTVEPTDTPNPTNTVTPRPRVQVTPTPPLFFANGSFAVDDFGQITNPFQTDLELFRWYLVQVAPGSRWIDWVNLTQENRGFGLKSIDYQSCGALCNVAAVQMVPAEENKIYTLSVDAKTEPGSDDGLIYLDFLDASRVSIEAVAQEERASQWQKQILSAKAPESARFVRIMLYSTNEGQGVIYWNNVILEVAE